MRNSAVRYITLTALMLALTVLFQSIRTIIPVLSSVAIFGPFNLSTLIIGSLVNLALIIAAWRVGFWSGVAVSVLSTFIALLQGHLPTALMLPVVSLGNVALVAVVWLLRDRHLVLSVVAAAVAKFLVLWAMVSWFVAPTLASNEATAKVAKVLSVTFSWPQLLTALIGGVLALLIWPRLKRSGAGA